MTTSEKKYHTAPDKFMIKSLSDCEVSIKWKIKHFPSIDSRPDERIISPKFNCADAVWSLVIYPNGTTAFRNVGYVLMFLRKVHSTTSEHDTVFKFDVIDENQIEVYETMPVKMKCRGNGRKWLSCAIKREDILNPWYGISSDGTLIVSFHLTVIQNANSADVSTHEADKKNKEMLKKCKHCLKPLIRDFESLFTNPRFSDVTLKLGHNEFLAHKVVLGCRSKVFAAMFEHDMKENRNNTVELVEMEVTAVRDMLRYIYCGDVRQLSPSDAVDLYVAADRYDLQELLKICRKVILENVSTNNVCDIAIVADLRNDKQLNDAVKSFLHKNIKEFIRTEKWRIFSKEYSDLSVKLLESVILTE